MLSNLGCYLTIEELKELIQKMSNYYMYRWYCVSKNTKYQKDWSGIYDLDRLFRIMENENLELSSFIGL